MIVRKINKAIRYAQDKLGRDKFMNLEATSLCILRYSDAGYSTNYDLLSNLGRVVLTMDESGAAVLILF